MDERELIQKATKLIRRYDNMRILGARGEWSGSARQGFMFNPKHGGGSTGASPPTDTGACCFENGSCSVVTQELCEGSGGVYQGDGTLCEPNPCPPVGACCIDAECSIVSEESCNNSGGTYQGDGTSCEPNPCLTHPCVGGGDPEYVCTTFEGISFGCGCVNLASTSIVVTSGDVNGCYFTQWSGTLWSGAGVNDQDYDYDLYASLGCSGGVTPSTSNLTCYIWCEGDNWRILLANPSTHHAAFYGVTSDLNLPVDNLLGPTFPCGTVFTVSGAVGLPAGNLYAIATGGSVDLRACDCQPDSTLSISVELDWEQITDCVSSDLSWTSHFSASGAVAQISQCYFRVTGSADVNYTCCPGHGVSGVGSAFYTIDVFQDGSDWKLSVSVEKAGENWCGFTSDILQQQNIDLMSCNPFGIHAVSNGTTRTLTGTVTVSP